MEKPHETIANPLLLNKNMDSHWRYIYKLYRSSLESVLVQINGCPLSVLQSHRSVPTFPSPGMIRMSFAGQPYGIPERWGGEPLLPLKLVEPSQDALFPKAGWQRAESKCWYFLGRILENITGFLSPLLISFLCLISSLISGVCMKGVYFSHCSGENAFKSFFARLDKSLEKLILCDDAIIDVFFAVRLFSSCKNFSTFL